MKYYISVLAILACLPWSGVMRAARGGPAADPPSFAFPHDMATYRITAAFDLDPATGAQADWTGWRSDDTGTGSGHAYDGHNGTDTGLPNGTALYAIAPGTVTSLRESVPDDDHSDTGNYLIMRHTIGSAVYEVEHSGRESGFVNQLENAGHGHRNQRAGFDDLTVSTGNGVRQGPERNHGRKIVRVQAGINSDRLSDGVFVDAARHILHVMPHHQGRRA